jgi:hypothetical protein
MNIAITLDRAFPTDAPHLVTGVSACDTPGGFIYRLLVIDRAGIDMYYETTRPEHVHSDIIVFAREAKRQAHDAHSAVGLSLRSPPGCSL